MAAFKPTGKPSCPRVFVATPVWSKFNGSVFFTTKALRPEGETQILKLKWKPYYTWVKNRK